MHVPEIGRFSVLQRLGDDLTQALGRKGVIGQPRQGQPLETDLTAVAFPALPDGAEVVAKAMEDRFNLVEVTVDAVHGVVLADILPEIDESLRDDPQAEFLEDLASDGIPQRLAMVLAAAGQHKELSLLGADPHRQDLIAAQDDGARRRPDPGGSTA